MGRIIEKSRTVYASWPAGVASPGPGGSYCSSRQVTTVEPITSTIERGNVLLPEPSRRGSQTITEARTRSKSSLSAPPVGYSRVIVISSRSESGTPALASASQNKSACGLALPG
jgi:hypothetical protein